MKTVLRIGALGVLNGSLLHVFHEVPEKLASTQP